MRSIQTSHTFPLASVKPLGRQQRYRDYCVNETRRALGVSSRRREVSPVSGAPLEPFGRVEGLEYLRCPESGSVFLASLPSSHEWTRLLAGVNSYRHSPPAFDSDLTRSRSDNVYLPKLEWIQNTLRLQGLHRPSVMEVTTAPSDFTPLLRESGSLGEIVTADEMTLVMAGASDGGAATQNSASRHQDEDGKVAAAVLLESLDRVDDPAALLRSVAGRLTDGGLLFVTALVFSGFDLAVLGLKNLYLYPPDRANCFTLAGLEELLARAGFTLVEVSTPGVLDVEIVQAHLAHDPSISISPFERQLIEADDETRAAFQEFLQQCRMSSFARVVGRRDR